MGIVTREFKYRGNSVLKELHLLIEELYEKYEVNCFELDLLTEREKLFLYLFYQNGYTLSKIAAIHGISSDNISRIMEKSGEKFKKVLRERVPESAESKRTLDIAAKLVLIRKHIGYSKKEVQEALSLSFGELSSIENAETNLDNDLLLRFCELYKVTIDWLMGMSIHPEVDKGNGQDILVRELTFIKRELISDLSSLNKNDQELVKNLVERLKSFSRPHANNSINFEVQEKSFYIDDTEYENTTIEELNLSVRSYNCLKKSGYNTLRDLILKSAEIGKIRNLGITAHIEIAETLSQYGFEIKFEQG